MTDFPEFYTEELSNKIRYIEQEKFTDEKKVRLVNEVSFLTDMLNSFVVYLHNEAYASPGRRVAWRLINSTRFGAFAYSHTDEQHDRSFDFIGINLGTLCILYDNFTHILSSNKAFIGVGEWYKEDVSRSSSLLTPNADNESPFTIPLCPVRAEFAKILTMTALNFVIFHESAHLYNGHVDWVRNSEKKPAAFIDDFPETIIPKSHLVRHFFEVDADGCALHFTLNHAIYWSEEFPKNLTMSELQRTVSKIAWGSEKRFTKTIIYSLYVLFRSTDPSPWDEKYIGGRFHPRELLRARYMINRYWELLGYMSHSPPAPTTLDVVIDAVLNAETDLANMIDRAVDIESFQKVMHSQLASKHIQEVGKIQWRLIPELAPYVRGDKYPRPGGEFLKEKISKSYSEL